MTIQTTESSHPMLSHADSIAASTADVFLLVGRVLLGWLFLVSSVGSGGKLWNPGGFAGYLKVLGVPAPDFWSWIGALVEFVVGAALVLGSAPDMPRCSAHCSSSLRPRWRIATGNIRPLRWGISTITSSRTSPSSAAR